MLSTPWVATSPAPGVVTVTSSFHRTGSNSLLLSGSSSSSSALAETTLTLNLTNKRNVILNFWAQGASANIADPPPSGNFSSLQRSFDGISISTNLGITWRSAQSLTGVTTLWQNFNVPLDNVVAQLGGTYNSSVKIRFSIYDRGFFPSLGGVIFDDVTVTADDDLHLTLQFPTGVTEGDTGQATLGIPAALGADLVVALSSPAPVMVPASVTIPAGQTSVPVPFTVQDDSVFNNTRSVVVQTSVAGVNQVSANVTIQDNEAPPAMTLNLPSSLVEGGTATNNASVSIDKTAGVPLTVTLSSTPSGQLTLPASVTIPAGQPSVSFTAKALADSIIDGDVPIVVTASCAGLQSTTASVTAVDADSRVFSLTLPATVNEGGLATGTISSGINVANDLVVSLTSDHPETVSVPATVTIPAGSKQATFALTGVDNNLTDGSRTANVTASANTFTSSTKSIVAKDNDAVSYRLTTSVDDMEMVDTSAPITVTVKAIDIEGNVIGNAVGSLNLNVTLADGSSLPLNPGTATLTGTGWAGSVTLPTSAGTGGVSIQISDGNGLSASGAAFDSIRSISLVVSDLAWDATRNLLYASVPQGSNDPHANQVVIINPASGQITGSIVINADPGKLVVTGDGQYLYVALNASAQIARVNLATLAVEKSFAVGTDATYGTLYPESICAVAGQPKVIVVSRKRSGYSPRFNGVAVYDDGVMRPVVDSSFTGSNVLAPSSDPSIFYGYDNEVTDFAFRRMKVDQNGITDVAKDENVFSGFNASITSIGDRVFQGGVQVDGTQMRRLGALQTSGLCFADAQTNRLFFLESSSGSYKSLSAYDPATFARIVRVTLPTSYSGAFALVRCGSNGLAFATASTVKLVSSSRLVPPYASADLVTTVTPSSPAAAQSQSVTYSITVSNSGPNVARSPVVTAMLSSGVTVQSANATLGSPSTSGSVVKLAPGDLPVGGVVTLTVKASSANAGATSCSVGATSASLDPDFSNNSAIVYTSVGYRTASEAVNALAVPANGMIFDATRNVFWATIPSTADPVNGRCVVTVNPSTGVVSQRIPVIGDPKAQCLALSGNGRYLYLGLMDVPEAHRIDLENGGSFRIPTGINQWGEVNYVQDIEVLDGDGTSILVAGSSDHSVAVYDNVTRRSNVTPIYSVDRITRTDIPGMFAGYDNYSSGFEVSQILVTASGVSIGTKNGGLVQYYGADIQGDGGSLILSSTGTLVNMQNVTLKVNFGLQGTPWVDTAHQRALLVNGNNLRFFDTGTFATAGTLPLPVTGKSDRWALQCARWGLDGVAVAGGDGFVYLGRTTYCIPPSQDSNNNGIPDAWEIANYGCLCSNPSDDPQRCGTSNAFAYLFGMTPGQGGPSPVQTTMVTDASHQPMIRMVFPRRTNLSPKPYRIDLSCDLKSWTPAQSVTETVLSTQTVNGVSVETVECDITPIQSSGGCFARLVWTGGAGS